jgi:site-specific DNA recombinase
LSEAGYRTHEGNRWSDTSVERPLRDTTARGMYRGNHSKRTPNGRIVKPEDQWVWIPVEPVVTEELWDRCNKLLDGNRQHQRKGKIPVQLFAGLIYCSCGKKMYVPSNTPKYVCQTCRNKLPVIDLEAIFVEELKNLFVSQEEVADHLKAADQNITAKEQLLSVLSGEEEKLKAEIDRVYRLYVDAKLNGDGFAGFYRPLDERRKQLNEEIPRLQAEVDLLKIDHLAADHVVSEARDLYSRWPRLERDEKHRIIESITEKIVIGRGEIDITLCHLPSSEELTKEQRKLVATTRLER